MPSSRVHSYYLLLAFSLLSTCLSSSTNYNPSHYDYMRHFTPDGRLLQVEYAMKASDHSAPLVVCQLDKDTLVLLSIQPSDRAQDRLVILEDSVAVALSGVLADNLAVLRHAHKQWLEWKYLFGEENATPAHLIHVLSTEIAKECHWNTFQGGIRPFGASLLLVAKDEEEVFRILQTNPSGSIVEIQNQSETEVAKPLGLTTVLGGGDEERRKIEAAVQKWNDKHKSTSSDQSPVVWQKLRVLTRILLEAKQETAPTGFFFKRKAKKKENEEDGDNPNSNPQLQAVLVSKKLGIHRLNASQVERLLQEAEEASAK